jgi:hypothetical protein
MNLCSEDHDEVCFEGRKCPLCDVRSDLKETIEKHKREIQQLEEKIDGLEEQIREEGDRP